MARRGGSGAQNLPRIWGNPSRNPNFAGRYPPYTVDDMRRGDWTVRRRRRYGRAISGPSPRSRGSCITKPHRKGTLGPPLRQSRLLALVTFPRCLIMKHRGMTALGVGASQVAGLLGEGPHPAGGWAGMMWRTPEGRGGIRGQRAMASTKFRPHHHVPTARVLVQVQNPNAVPGEEK